VVDRIKVSKVAGTFRLGLSKILDEGLVRIEGEIYTSNGGALLLREGQDFKVLETLESSPVGSQFEKVLAVSPARHDDIYLLVDKAADPILEVGQMISKIQADSYLLYGPANNVE
jgi:hypothetical protein